MHGRETVLTAVAYARSGMNASEIARALDVPRETVRDWMAGAVPRNGPCSHDFAALSGAYAYLLGLYLGDGCLSAHPRNVYKLRIVLDVRYPGIIARTAAAMEEIRGGPVAVQRRVGENCVEVHSYWTCWPCMFSQHGAGPKHKRSIVLADWQQRIVNRWPDRLLQGLIHSDGCRFDNTGRCGWVWPRYSFKNCSDDIRAIFCPACNQLDLHWTAAGAHTIYVSRKASVAKLDEFIGPKK